MLAQAIANLAETGLDIPLLQADFRCLPALFNRFIAVILMRLIAHS